MEWGIGISVLNPEEEDKSKYIRRLEFESKEGTAAAIYSRIREGADSGTVRIERVEPPDEAQRRRRVKDIFTMGGGDDVRNIFEMELITVRSTRE
jgi:hypothetical protein